MSDILEYNYYKPIVNWKQLQLVLAKLANIISNS